jgi:hypothetical protein
MTKNTPLPPPALDDTQPNRPIVLPSTGAPAPEQGGFADEGERGPGCGLMGVVGLIVAAFALAIVALAGAAGWTAGQREANGLATATQNAAIREQIDRIPADIASGNIVLLDTRIRFLATLTPGVPGIGDFAATATALYLTQLPTATATPAPPTETPQSTTTPAATATQAAPNATPTPAPGGQFDLAALLSEAQLEVQSGQWQDAIDLLDAIMAIDPAYEAVTVRAAIGQALNSYALELYGSGQPAAANIIVGRAEELGVLQGNLSYERYVAELYLNARAGASLGSPAAMSDLQRILNEGPGGRYYDDAVQLLYELYIRQGDNWVAQGEYCPAVPLYQNAVSLLSSGAANGKLSTAQSFCALATPTPDPLNPFAVPGGAVTPIPGFQPLGGP